jgi:putative peptidoglycan lipid II flippase
MAAARDESSGTARDSLVVGVGTAVSRLTGVGRVVMVGAVLGPTTFGDTFQLTNSLPNLIYYGFLAGSLFSSLLVPALVRHVDAGDPGRTARLSGGFLGFSWLAALGVVPLVLLVIPPAVGLLAPGDGVAVSEQIGQARLLLLLMCPQVFLYALAGASGSVLNAHRRFALAAVAPAVENLAMMSVLAAMWVIYGPVAEQGSQPTGALVLLGLGSTGAVAAHAGLGWAGARTQGVTVRPRAGWRDPEVLSVVRRAVLSVLQAGLLALQLLVLLLLAGRAAGGTVALQMVFNFYALPIELVATPVGLALIPRLSRHHRAGRERAFRETYLEGLDLALFLAVPAAIGYMLLAGPVAHAIGVGAMASTTGVGMMAGTLAALAPGIVGQTAFYISLQAAYARQDTRTPLVSMSLQTVVCLSLALATLAVPGEQAVRLLGAAYAAGALVGGLHLTRAVCSRGQLPARRFVPLARRLSVGALVMALPVLAVARLLVASVDGRAGWVLALVLGSLVGATVFLGVQRAMRSPELAALRRGVRGEPSRHPLPEEAVP